MSVFKRRSKMISFRISEQEYKDLMEVCAARGVRSLSDLARDAIQKVLDATPSNGGSNGNGDASGASGIAPDLMQLHGRMMKLEGEVQRLAQLVTRA